MNRLLLYIALIVIPINLFSQNIKVDEIFPFVAIEKGDYKQAIDSLNNLLLENPKADFLLAKAEALYKIGKFEEALETCSKIEKIKPGLASGLELKIHLKSCNQEALQKALNANIHSKYRLSLYDFFNDETFSYIQETGMLDSLLSNQIYSVTEKQIYQAKRLMDASKFTQAIFLLDGMVSKGGNTDEVYYLLSKVYYLVEDFNKAEECINKALVLKSLCPDYLIQAALIYNQLGKDILSIEQVEKAVRLEPYCIGNYILWLQLLVETEDFQKANKISLALDELVPENAEYLYLKSKLYYLQEDNLEALKAINASMQYKNTKECFELRGDIYSATGVYEFAVRDYAMYLDIEPYNGEIYAKKGLARLKLNDKKGACTDWEKALRYGSYKAAEYLEVYCK